TPFMAIPLFFSVGLGYLFCVFRSYGSINKWWRPCQEKSPLCFLPRFVMVSVCFATKTHAKTEISLHRQLPVTHGAITLIPLSGYFSWRRFSWRHAGKLRLTF